MSWKGNISRGTLGKNPNSALPKPKEDYQAIERNDENLPHAAPLEGSVTRGWPRIIRKLRWHFRALLAEFFGTFLLMTLGLGVGMQVTLFGAGGGSAINIHFGWGLAVALSVYTTGGVSAHLNPAVTFTFALFRSFPWDYVIPFWIAQVSGAFCGAALVYLDYRPRIQYLEESIMDQPRLIGLEHTQSAAMFATYPGEGVGLTGGLIDEIITTSLLLAFVFALDDQRNVAPKSNLGPFMVGMVVFGLCMSFASVSGLAMNPARDFGPRLFISLAGWGPGAFTCDGHYWWVPIVGPLIGGPIGALMYEFFVCVDIEEEIERQMEAELQAKEMDATRSDTSDGDALMWTPLTQMRTPEVGGLTRRQSVAHLHLFGKKESVKARSMMLKKGGRSNPNFTKPHIPKRSRSQFFPASSMRRNMSDGRLLQSVFRSPEVVMGFREELEPPPQKRSDTGEGKAAHAHLAAVDDADGKHQ
mmetsp:Transcript_26439/g.46872  ORF Transcript_26439/g.46872 Transcript_26439/m.46872 type:complete len:472 (-) Transcript_26439:77-1492(-)|eukprot:CAMPEP_0197527714 /NCGR_PEP_ID=MMETSP1318-20131121/22624_1 /TAXON_ID=552666 /ORGANISM="Partenskyella glossopodia, Strain RCC365" /LENGTH=471 /DNA_ID=CAMNT_0043082499 /DNA_START=46 /DNA_END=1461 /DNA_ORIENTATION=-